jgi:acetylornithine deacetylase/succinyl-diaminopimelate desuccinylase-like protein
MSELTRREIVGGAAAVTALSLAGPALAQSGNANRLRGAIESAQDMNVRRLQQWIANPSIAAENRNMAEGAAYMADLARTAGFQQSTVVQTRGAPGVFATMDNGARRTLALYFMYDVKQFDPAEWSSPPLEARVIDRPGLGKCVVGRGAVNQKGPENNVLSALAAFKAAGLRPPVNLVLVAEGEEEIASPHFRDITTQPQVLAALKRCEGVYIPFASQGRNGAVDVNLGAKGAVELELISTGAARGRGPAKDIHSSLAAMVDSPAWHLVNALNTLTDKGGTHPAVPGWFDRVKPLTAREREITLMNARANSEAEFKRGFGVQRFIDDLSWEDANLRLVSQPTINIEGLTGGYMGPGGKTVLPGRATAKIDLRLVPDMTPEDCVAKLKKHLADGGYGDIEVKVTGGYGPTQTDENSRLIKAELATYRAMGASATLNARIAGSWPGVVFTGEPVSLPAGQYGLGHGSGAHAPDEYFVVESANPKVAGLAEGAMSHVNLWYEIARG